MQLENLKVLRLRIINPANFLKQIDKVPRDVEAPPIKLMLTASGFLYRATKAIQDLTKV